MLGFLIPFSGVGNATAVIALTVYALLPMVRNTYTGMTNVAPAILEAARGMGSTRLANTLQGQAPAGHARHYERHTQHGDHDHRPRGHRELHRRGRPRRGDIPRHHDEQRRHDHGGQPAHSRAGAGGGFHPRPRREAHEQAQREGQAHEPHRGGSRRARLRSAGVRLAVHRRQGRHDKHRHQAHDRAVHTRRGAGHPHRAGHRPERRADAGRGRRHLEHTARDGERGVRHLPRVHRHRLEHGAHGERRLRREPVRRAASSATRRTTT